MIFTQALLNIAKYTVANSWNEITVELTDIELTGDKKIQSENLM